MEFLPVTPTPANADALARIGRIAWQGREAAWGPDKFLRMGRSGTVLMLADPALSAALIVLRVVLDEAEVLNLGVVPPRRGEGIARALLARAEIEAARLGVATVFLDVAIDNVPARRLYARAGYGQIGTRPGYYRRPDGSRADALCLSKALAPGLVTPLAGLGRERQS